MVNSVTKMITQRGKACWYSDERLINQSINPQRVIHLNHLYLRMLLPSLRHSLGWDGEEIESHDNNTIHKTISLVIINQLEKNIAKSATHLTVSSPTLFPSWSKIDINTPSHIIAAEEYEFSGIFHAYNEKICLPPASPHQIIAMLTNWHHDLEPSPLK